MIQEENMNNKILIAIGIIVAIFIAVFYNQAIADTVNAQIRDHYKSIIQQTPHNQQVCSEVYVPNRRGPDDMLSGAIIGGILGNQNSTASGNVCRTETRYNEEARTVYSHSTITFVYEGKQYKLNFKK